MTYSCEALAVEVYKAVTFQKRIWGRKKIASPLLILLNKKVKKKKTAVSYCLKKKKRM